MTMLVRHLKGACLSSLLMATTVMSLASVPHPDIPPTPPPQVPQTAEILEEAGALETETVDPEELRRAEEQAQDENGERGNRITDLEQRIPRLRQAEESLRESEDLARERGDEVGAESFRLMRQHVRTLRRAFRREVEDLRGEQQEFERARHRPGWNPRENGHQDREFRKNGSPDIDLKPKVYRGTYGRVGPKSKERNVLRNRTAQPNGGAFEAGGANPHCNFRH